MIGRFDIPPGVLTDLVGAPSEPSSTHLLRAIKLSELRLSLTCLFRCLPRHQAETAAAFEVLFAMDRHDREALHDILLQSWAGEWLRRCLRDLRAPPRGGDRGDLSPRRLAYLSQLAAVVALRGGIDVDLTVACATGSLMLPGFGLADTRRLLPTLWRVRVSERVLTASSDGHRLVVPADAEESTGWLPLRRLTPTYRGQNFAASLDDLDPLRDCYRMPIASRLDGSAFDRWTDLAGKAWELLVRRAPRYAAEVANGLATLVPLTRVPPARGRSASSCAVFGAAAMTEPEQAVGLAVGLVHEWQHSKLCAVMTGAPLVVGGGTDRYFAPWRPDPRPLPGLLHGAFAFLAVGEVWNALRAEPGLEATAELRFATCREQLVPALRALAAAPRLTDAGRALVTAMRAHHERLLAEALPAPVVRRARSALRTTYEAWLRRNEDAPVSSFES